MVVLSPEAAGQLMELIRHYEELDRPEASNNLLKAIEAAKIGIMAHPGVGLPAPRPYPALKKPGRLWVKQGRHWISYNATNPPVISGVFFDTVDIPGRS